MFQSITPCLHLKNSGKKTLEEITKELANIKAEIGRLREERELQHHKTENEQKAKVARLMYHRSLPLIRLTFL